MFIIEFTKFLKKGNNMDFLEKLYLDFRKENIFGFAHYFLAKWLMIVACLFCLTFFDTNNLMTNFIVSGLIVFAIGILNELLELGWQFYLVKDSRQDILMNIYGIVSGFFYGIGIFTLTVWFI